MNKSFRNEATLSRRNFLAASTMIPAIAGASGAAVSTLGAAEASSGAVPKKTKTTEDKNQPSAEPSRSRLTKKTGKRRSGGRATAAKRPRATVTKDLAERAAQISALPAAEPSKSGEPSEELIRLRAYFISERRRRFALPGDAESDWLEARRQLLSEARH